PERWQKHLILKLHLKKLKQIHTWKAFIMILNDGVFTYKYISLPNDSRSNKECSSMEEVLYKIVQFMKIQIFLPKCILTMEPCLKMITKHIVVCSMRW